MSRTTTEVVLDRLQAAGVTVSVVGDRLRLTPTDKVTSELAAAVRFFKPGLLCWLTWDQDEAARALDTCLDRIGQLGTALPDGAIFWSAQGRVDRWKHCNHGGGASRVGHVGERVYEGSATQHDMHAEVSGVSPRKIWDEIYARTLPHLRRGTITGSTPVLSFTASGDVGPYRWQIAQGRLPEPGSLGAADVLSSFMSASPIPWFAPPETVSPPLALSTRRRRGEDA